MTETTLRLPAASQDIDALIVLLHGVGSSAQDIFGIAPALSAAAPSATIVAPSGIEPFDMNPMGRQWFSIQGVTEENRLARIDAARPVMQQMIEEEAEKGGVPLNRVFIVGFSQGTIMSLHMAASGFGVGGVVGLSGRLAGPIDARSDWPPIRLIHGSEDPIMPLPIAQKTKAWLAEAGCEAPLTVFQGLGHQIDAHALEAASTAVQELVQP